MGREPVELRVCDDMESGVCEALELLHDSAVSAPMEVWAMEAMLGSRMSWRGGLMLTGLAGVACRRTSSWVEMLGTGRRGTLLLLLGDDDDDDDDGGNGGEDDFGEDGVTWSIGEVGCC
jgi:hypothetical protein